MWDFDRHRELSKKKKEDYFSFSDGSGLDIIMIKQKHTFTSTMLFKQLFICEHRRVKFSGRNVVFRKNWLVEKYKLCCCPSTVHSVFFPKLCLILKKSISGLIELKISGKTPTEVLYAPIYFWGVYF